MSRRPFAEGTNVGALQSRKDTRQRPLMRPSYNGLPYKERGRQQVDALSYWSRIESNTAWLVI